MTAPRGELSMKRSENRPAWADRQTALFTLGKSDVRYNFGQTLHPLRFAFWFHTHHTT